MLSLLLQRAFYLQSNSSPAFSKPQKDRVAKAAVAKNCAHAILLTESDIFAPKWRDQLNQVIGQLPTEIQTCLHQGFELPETVQEQIHAMEELMNERTRRQFCDLLIQPHRFPFQTYRAMLHPFLTCHKKLSCVIVSTEGLCRFVSLFRGSVQ